MKTEAEIEIMNIKEQEYMSFVRYSKVLWGKPLRCSPVHEEAFLKSIRQRTAQVNQILNKNVL